MMRDLLDPFGRHAAAAEDVGEERPDVGWSLRAAESDQQHCVERS
jgi:hypothetical protein